MNIPVVACENFMEVLNYRVRVGDSVLENHLAVKMEATSIKPPRMNSLNVVVTISRVYW